MSAKSSIKYDSIVCDRILQQAFEKYDFVTHPIQKGKVFHTRVRTSVTPDETQLSEMENVSMESDYYISRDRMMLLNADYEIYSSPECVIQIHIKDKRVYIYDANGDSIRLKQIKALLSIKQQSYELVKFAPCISVGDTLLRYYLSPFSDEQQSITLELDKETNYMKSYLIYFKPGRSEYSMIRTEYLYTGMEKINRRMKSNFLDIVYDKNNNVQSSYGDFKIEDVRLIK